MTGQSNIRITLTSEEQEIVMEALQLWLQHMPTRSAVPTFAAAIASDEQKQQIAQEAASIQTHWQTGLLLYSQLLQLGADA